MHLESLIIQLGGGGKPLAIVRDEAERQAVYNAAMRRLNALNPWLIRAHSPAAIHAHHGGVLHIMTRSELLVAMGPIPEVAIPAGEFWLGYDQGYMDERPMHQQTSAAFWIMQYPITVRSYEFAVRSGVVDPPPPSSEATWKDQCARSACPVVMVHQQEAECFASWLSELTGHAWRLPTEAEWEYAARGDDQRRYSWGDDHDPWRANVIYDNPDAGNDEDDDVVNPHPTLNAIGWHPSGDSPFGVSDMLGNIDEWTASPLSTYGTAASPNNPGETMVVRGGNYTMTLQRVTYRGIASRHERRPTLGFRLVRSR